MKKGETLADRIAGVLTTAPGSLDLDDEIDETAAKLTEFDENLEEDEKLLSTFRKQNIDLLADVDERYAGKTVSRKKLDSHFGDDNSSKELEIDSEVDEHVIDDDDDEQYSDDSNQDSENIESDNENSDESFKEDPSGDNNFVHINNADISVQMKKGLCVRNQMNMWESLLETRIQIQKCLLTSNKMPQNEIYKEMNTNKDFSKHVSETKKSVTNLLDKLLLLQNLVVKKYPETKNTFNQQKFKEPEKNTNGDDEEINSDTDEIDEDSESEEEKPKKRQKLIFEYDKEISDRHDIYKIYRNNTIQKWHEKTRIAILKQNSNPHSVINHIEHTLSDKTKLVKRTQLKRSEYRIIGEKIQDTDEDNKFVEEYNANIYDDDDFYHQLLRELIEVKSADLTDPVQLGQQWIQLQNLRSKMKRKIDTKATKGRKIRYVVHPKLVNFMAPIDENNWTDEAKTELYSSLFGKKQIVNK